MADTMPTKIPRGAQARETKKRLARLKDKGLFGGNAAEKLTRYRINLTRKYSDVLSGHAAVVSMPRKEARSFRDRFRVKGGKVVVPKEAGETIRYNAKDKELVGYRRLESGKRVRKSIAKRRFSNVSDLPRAKPGERIYYSLPFGQGDRVRRYTFEDIDQLQNFMMGYERTYKNWVQYVEVENVQPDEYDDGAD